MRVQADPGAAFMCVDPGYRQVAHFEPIAQAFCERREEGRDISFDLRAHQPPANGDRCIEVKFEGLCELRSTIKGGEVALR